MLRHVLPGTAWRTNTHKRTHATFEKCEAALEAYMPLPPLLKYRPGSQAAERQT